MKKQSFTSNQILTSITNKITTLGGCTVDLTSINAGENKTLLSSKDSTFSPLLTTPKVKVSEVVGFIQDRKFTFPQNIQANKLTFGSFNNSKQVNSQIIVKEYQFTNNNRDFSESLAEISIDNGTMRSNRLSRSLLDSSLCKKDKLLKENRKGSDLKYEDLIRDKPYHNSSNMNNLRPPSINFSCTDKTIEIKKIKDIPEKKVKPLKISSVKVLGSDNKVKKTDAKIKKENIYDKEFDALINKNLPIKMGNKNFVYNYNKKVFEDNKNRIKKINGIKAKVIVTTSPIAKKISPIFTNSNNKNEVKKIRKNDLSNDNASIRNTPDILRNISPIKSIEKDTSHDFIIEKNVNVSSPNKIIPSNLLLVQNENEVEEEANLADVNEFSAVEKYDIDFRNYNKKLYKSTFNIKKDKKINLNNEINEVETLKQYDEIVNKFLIGNNTQNEVSFNNMSNINESNLNISKISNLEYDFDYLKYNKNEFKKLKLLYQKEIMQIQAQLKDLDDKQISEFEKIKKKLFLEIKALKEKFIQEGSKLIENNKEYREKKINQQILELETLRSNYYLKDNNYKQTIKKLISELKHITQINNLPHINLIEVVNLNESIMKDFKDVIDDYNEEIPVLVTQSNYQDSPLKNNIVTINNYYYGEEDSIIAELEDFKKDNINNYLFEIPEKYQLSKNVKIDSEDMKNDGKLIRYYNNSVVEIVTKNKTVTRLFPDGYSITFYANKDIRQNFPKGKVLYYYAKNKSTEFNIQNEGYIAYRFKNDQFEKHFFDGRKYIKFSDGSIKIFRPNGEELNQFTDNTIQRKDKFGNITNLKSKK